MSYPHLTIMKQPALMVEQCVETGCCLGHVPRLKRGVRESPMTYLKPGSYGPRLGEGPPGYRFATLANGLVRHHRSDAQSMECSRPWI